MKSNYRKIGISLVRQSALAAASLLLVCLSSTIAIAETDEFQPRITQTTDLVQPVSLQDEALEKSHPKNKKSKKRRKPSSSLKAPPQYVLLAFDGSLNVDFWKESTSFADTVMTTADDTGKKRPIKFTYFINPVYYIEKGSRQDAYKTPALGRPVSCIGWSNPTNSSGDRVRATNNAFQRGHEIGSHANSHCDASGTDRNNPLYGHRWEFAEWQSEFEQVNSMLFKFIPTASKSKFVFNKSDVVGFRAPLLAVTDGLWPTLQKFNFRYDTSKISRPDYWPQKMSWGGWNFPLAQIKVAGTQRTTLSMDYNWFVYQTAGVTKPGLTESERLFYKNQVLDSYKYYFKKNYFGGRAPIHIGHHFSKWNGGAYWQAMREFAQFVCGMPDVRCVTYKEYADWLDQLDSPTLQAYRNGDFQRPAIDPSIKIRDIATPLLAQVQLDISQNGYEAFIPAEDRDKAEVAGWNPQLQINFVPYKNTSISHDELVNLIGKGNTAFIRAAVTDIEGNALDWQTYKIENLGTAKEFVSEHPLEDKANQGEGIEAHLIAD